MQTSTKKLTVSMSKELDQLVQRVRQCTLCEKHLPLGPRPVIQVSTEARIMVIGQAPGTRVHATGIPWNDPSGDRLREWLEMDREEFYESGHLAIMPMGFCYPGRGKSGDLPPRPECAPTWHEQLYRHLPNIRLTLLIGQYAQTYYLPEKPATLTETVHHFHDYLPEFFPLPHPSPRNNRWLRNNPWFESEVLPELRRLKREILRF